jgi:lysophospholipase L1-like esterase
VRHKEWYAGAALSIGVIAALALLEVALRLVPIQAVEVHGRGPVTFDNHRQFFTYDPELGWRGRPSMKGAFAGWEFVTQVSLNELGFRDAAHWRHKQSAQFEILLLGDSIKWGYGVEEGRRYSDLLPKELQKFGIDAVINNAAVPGYDTGLELLLYRQLKGLGCPDLVLIGLYGNDIWENGSPSQGPYAKPYFRLMDGQLQLANVPVPAGDECNGRRPETENGWIAWIKGHLRVYALVGWIRETMRQTFKAKPPVASEMDAPGVEITATLLREWAGEIERDHQRAAVIVLPDETGLARGETLATEMAAAQSGVKPVLRLTDAFREAASAQHRPFFYHLDGAHWTEQAHEVAARHIAQLLVEASVFQRAPRQCTAQT